MTLFWELHLRRELTHLASSAGRAERRARSLEQRVEELEARCEKSLLVTEALWTLVRDGLGLTDEQLSTPLPGAEN